MTGGSWIAKSAVHMIGVFAGVFVLDISGRPVLRTALMDSQPKVSKQCKTCMPPYEKSASLLEHAHAECSKYMETGARTDDTLRAAFGMVGLDAYVRSGMDVGIGAEPNDNGIADLRQIWGVLDSGDMRGLPPECKILLNPTFGDGSALVGGADADIIVCDMLVDIKTAKFGRFKKEHWQQLVGYWLLSLIGSGRGFEWEKINRLGVYFSRHGRLETVPVPDFSNAGLEKAVKDFRDLANDCYGRKGKDNV